MGDYTLVNSDKMWTSTASAAITGGQLLQVSGAGTVAPTTANTQRAIAVAGSDAPNGGRVNVWPIPGNIHESTNNNAGTITAGAAITAGGSAGVDTGALATVAAAGTLIGIALTTAATATKVRWIGT